MLLHSWLGRAKIPDTYPPDVRYKSDYTPIYGGLFSLGYLCCVLIVKIRVLVL